METTGKIISGFYSATNLAILLQIGKGDKFVNIVDPGTEKMKVRVGAMTGFELRM